MTPRPATPVFPVVLKDGATALPEVPACFIVASNGVFLQRTTELFSATVRVEGVPGLQPHDDTLSLRIPRLPRSHLERAMGFFHAVYERWRAEGILIMFYSPSLQRFVLDAPPQVVTGRFEHGRFRAELRLEYGACETPAGDYVKLGTFHSHGYASPRHSGIDIHDEMFDTGLHLTAGYVDSTLPEFAAAFVVGRTRFAVAPEDVLCPFTARRRPPTAWLDRVVVRCDPAPAHWGHGSDQDRYGGAASDREGTGEPRSGHEGSNGRWAYDDARGVTRGSGHAPGDEGRGTDTAGDGPATEPAAGSEGDDHEPSA
jgi:hypothetical protein